MQQSVSRALGTIDHREPHVDGMMLEITGYTHIGINITVGQLAWIGLGNVARIVGVEAQHKKTTPMFIKIRDQHPEVVEEVPHCRIGKGSEVTEEARAEH